MVTKECYFGMFSDKGNKLVRKVVDIAIRDSKDWEWMVRELKYLSSIEEWGGGEANTPYGEATDTAVMDAVWAVFSMENSSGLGEVALKYKGPWSVKRHTPDVHSPFPETLLITDCRGDMVGSVDTRREDEEDVARLTAAAPAMLLALKEIKAIIGKADHITDTIDDNIMRGLDIQACLLEALSKVEETT